VEEVLREAQLGIGRDRRETFAPSLVEGDDRRQLREKFEGFGEVCLG
jgi:hypothetical protein